MTRKTYFALLAIGVSIAVFIVVRAMIDFSRVKRVEIGTTALQPGTISKVVLKNNQSSQVDFILHCYFKVRSDGRPLFSEKVSLPPEGSAQFDVHPDLAGKELPRIVANRACEAVWQGPLGIKRSAWWFAWEYGKPAYQVNF